MNILLINHYAGSPDLGMEYRPYYFGHEWVKRGHNVTIISASFAHIRQKQPTIRHDFAEEIFNGVRYIWIKTPAYSGNSLGRIINILVFVCKLWLKSKIIAAKYNPEIVIASSTYPLDNYPAYRIAKKSKAQYIYEVHDLWPLSPKELGGYSKYHPFIMLMQAAENFAYRNVDSVISMLPKTLDHMINHGLSPSNWHYVPNGINPEGWDKNEQLPAIHLELLRKIRQQGDRIIAYTGSIGLANALENLIKAADILRYEKMSFVIMGEGPEKDKLNVLVKNSGFKNVFFLDPLQKKYIPAFLDQCDLLYIGLQRQSLFRFGISPNKLLDYMMAAKPVIQAIDAGNDIVSEAGCGISIEPENPEALADAIRKVLSSSKTEQKQLGENGRNYVIKNHDYSILAEQIISVFRGFKE
jgi:glycosyltransferase involved in cell wall biosynthesis